MGDSKDRLMGTKPQPLLFGSLREGLTFWLNLTQQREKRILYNDYLGVLPFHILISVSTLTPILHLWLIR